jgi:hypothetical protein
MDKSKILTFIPSNAGIEVSLRTVFRPPVRGKFLFLKQVLRGKKISNLMPISNLQAYLK